MFTENLWLIYITTKSQILTTIKKHCALLSKAFTVNWGGDVGLCTSMFKAMLKYCMASPKCPFWNADSPCIKKCKPGFYESQQKIKSVKGYRHTCTFKFMAWFLVAHVVTPSGGNIFSAVPCSFCQRLSLKNGTKTYHFNNLSHLILISIPKVINTHVTDKQTNKQPSHHATKHINKLNICIYKCKMKGTKIVFQVLTPKMPLVNSAIVVWCFQRELHWLFTRSN